jgi:translation initiation factor 1
MVGVCNQCGLPEDLCVCEAIAREQQKITVTIEKRKFGKNYTIVKGFKSEVNVVDIVKKLKGKFACGGTAKSGHVELQGNHTSRIKEALIGLGFPDETIEVK